MRKMMLIPAILWCVWALVNWGCNPKTEDEEVCQPFPQEVASGSCVIPADDEICCDENSCTLTHGDKRYTCNNPDMNECINDWIDVVCPTASASDRAAVAKVLRAHTMKLMSMARMNSVCL